MGRLPDDTKINLTSIDRANSDLTRIDEDLSRAEDRKIQLTTQIAQARALTQSDERKQRNSDRPHLKRKPGVRWNHGC